MCSYIRSYIATDGTVTVTIRSGYRPGSQLSKIILNNTYTLRYVSYTYYFILGLGLGLILYYFAELAAGPKSTSVTIIASIY